MPALNFRAEFVPAVENGLARLRGETLPHPGVKPKLQTIRAERKHPIKVGDTLYLFTGMRTKQCRKLGEVACKSVESFQIEQFGGWEGVDFPATAEREAFARADGFESEADMIHWFEKTHGLPFVGQLYRWSALA